MTNVEAEITAEQYEAAIPECCAYQGYEAHAKGMMLCWGLCVAIREGKKMNCTGCDMATREVSNVK